MIGNKRRLWVFFALCLGFWPGWVEAADPEVLKPRVPTDQIEEAKSWVNPYPATPENIEKGKALLSNEDLIVYERLVIGKDSSVSLAFAEAVVDEVEKITKIK